MKMYLKNNKNNNRLTIYIVLFVISFICSIKLIINDNTKDIITKICFLIAIF